jgi:hypothetical protein
MRTSATPITTEPTAIKATGSAYDVGSPVAGVRVVPAAVVTTPVAGVPALLTVLVSTATVPAAGLASGAAALLDENVEEPEAAPGVGDVGDAGAAGPPWLPEVPAVPVTLGAYRSPYTGFP